MPLTGAPYVTVAPTEVPTVNILYLTVLEPLLCLPVRFTLKVAVPEALVIKASAERIALPA